MVIVVQVLCRRAVRRGVTRWAGVGMMVVWCNVGALSCGYLACYWLGAGMLSRAWLVVGAIGQCAMGALLVRSWCTIGALLVHCRCAIGALLVRCRCATAALFRAQLVRALMMVAILLLFNVLNWTG